VRSFAPDIMQALKATSDQVLAEAATGDAFTGKVFKSFSASLANSMAWGARSEEPYTLARRQI